MPTPQPQHAKKTKRAGNWYEPHLLLLTPDQAYGTGDIVQYWLEHPDISPAVKERIETKKTSLQSSLGRYMATKKDQLEPLLTEEHGIAKSLEHLFKPVETRTYGPTGKTQTLYLGAQYAFVAARSINAESPVAMDNLILCRQLLLNNEIPDDGLAPPCAVEHVAPTPLVSNQSKLEPASPSVHSNKAPKETRRMKLGFIFSTFSLLTCLALTASSYLNTRNPELPRLIKAYKEHGLRAVAEQRTTAPNPTDGQRFINLWFQAFNPSDAMTNIQETAQPLLDHSNIGWRAKALHAVGNAYLNRGQLQQALTLFQEAESILQNRDHQRNDLCLVLYNQAECHFLLGDAFALKDCMDRADQTNAADYASMYHHYFSKYWLMKGQLEKAISCGDQSIKLSITLENKELLAYFSAHQALLLTATNDLDAGYFHLKRAQTLAANMADPILNVFIQRYEFFWAEKMNLPTAGIIISEKNNFSATRYYSDLTLSLADNQQKP